MITKKLVLPISIVILFCFSATCIAGNLHFGITSAIEDKIEELIDEPGGPAGDIIARIDSQPYHGAVLVFTYTGNIIDFDGLAISVDLYQDSALVQDNTPVQVVGEQLVAEIVDLKFHLSSNLDARLTISGSTRLPSQLDFSLSYDHFWPWMDWMLQPGDETEILGEFIYDCPDHPNRLGAHSSWDIVVKSDQRIEVFCGTEGIIYQINQNNVFVYNPFVGAIIQYGHTFELKGRQIGQEVHPGDLISRVDPSVRHIHYSVLRPLGWDENDWPYWRDDNDRSIFDSLYYRDPFYFHEPATWGYWYESTLPEGWIDSMKEIFEELNPGITPSKAYAQENNLETAMNKMPEVYTKQVSESLVEAYKNLISRLPKDAQQWVIGMGQFLEDEKLSKSEKGLFELLASTKDPLIYLTNLRIIDGISWGDVRWAKKDPIKPDNYMYLKDDVKELQEKGLFSEKAKQGLDRIVLLAENDYELRKGLYLINNFGDPNKRTFRYKVPDFNTQLFVLGRLLEKGIPEGYEIIALGAALDYGTVITIGDDEVDKEVVDYAYNMIKFIEETDKIIKEKGANWQAKNYPLGAAIALAGGVASNQYMSLCGQLSNRSWENVFSKKQMEKFEFDWMFISQDTIKEQRDYVLEQFYISSDNLDYLMDRIDDFVIGHLDHNDLLKGIVVNGRRAMKGYLVNPNYQWKLFKDEKCFYGDCLNWTDESSNLGESGNISTIKGHVVDRVANLGHWFVMYYEPGENVWRTVRTPVKGQAFAEEGQFGYADMSFMNFLDKKTMNRHYTPEHRFLVSPDSDVVKKIPVGYIFRRADGKFKYKRGIPPGNTRCTE